MSPTDRIPQALKQIAELLSIEGLAKHAGDINELRRLALSSSGADQNEFKTKITQDKWYWMGMGTIADVTLSDEEPNRRFVAAYHDLATACAVSDYGSIYSRDVASVFGGWLDEWRKKADQTPRPTPADGQRS